MTRLTFAMAMAFCLVAGTAGAQDYGNGPGWNPGPSRAGAPGSRAGTGMVEMGWGRGSGGIMAAA